MSDWLLVLLLTLGAGITMPIGAAIASVERIRPHWLEAEFRHSVIAFGGGALLAAVSLVLIPKGTDGLTPILVCVCFAGGGAALMILDRQLATSGTPASQLTAMLTDFVPEALALGATFTVSKESAILLAGIIALQNLPEGFNAYRELSSSTHYRGLRLVAAFLLMSLLGPAAGLTGHLFLSGYQEVVSCIMLFAAGGILYIIFQDIAPQARLENHWAPPLSAVAGFLLGLMGHVAMAA